MAPLRSWKLPLGTLANRADIIGFVLFVLANCAVVVGVYSKNANELLRIVVDPRVPDMGAMELGVVAYALHASAVIGIAVLLLYLTWDYRDRRKTGRGASDPPARSVPVGGWHRCRADRSGDGECMGRHHRFPRLRHPLLRVRCVEPLHRLGISARPRNPSPGFVCRGRGLPRTGRNRARLVRGHAIDWGPTSWCCGARCTRRTRPPARGRTNHVVCDAGRHSI